MLNTHHSANAITTWRVSEQEQLDRVLEGLSQAASGGGPKFRGGGRIWLQKGTWDTDITINHPWVELCGDGEGTEILGKVTVIATRTNIHNLCIRGVGKPYALRFQRKQFAAGAGNIPRNTVRNLVIGASFQGAGDGPVNGVEIDGSWLNTFECVTSAFCTGHGWVIDSTTEEPSTTHTFIECSATLNALNGWEIRQSLTGGKWLGGSAEGNGYGAPTTSHEINMASVISCSFKGVHIESTTALTLAQVFMSNCSAITFEGNTFAQKLDDMTHLPIGVPRWLEGASCNKCRVHNNLVNNWGGGRGVQFDERGYGNECYNNHPSDAVTPVDNRSVKHSRVFSTWHPSKMMDS